jgi:hypothetical protein
MYVGIVNTLLSSISLRARVFVFTIKLGTSSSVLIQALLLVADCVVRAVVSFLAPSLA